MKSKNEIFKGVIRKRKLSRKIKTSVLLLALTGLTSIFYLGYEVYLIIQNYNEMLRRDHQYNEYIRELEEDLFDHQTLVLGHLTTLYPEKEAVMEKASALEAEMRNILSLIGKNMDSSVYEIKYQYQSLNSNITGYLDNTDTFFEYIKNGNTQKANEYMNNTLINYINTATSELRSFNNIINEDIYSTKDELRNSTRSVYIKAVILLTIFLIISVICLLICIRISEKMINTDSMSGIANYDRFLEYCEKKTNIPDYAILMLNIKNFQYINQQFGINYGDAILTEYAHYLKSLCERQEFAARINGDNFIALIEKEHTASVVDCIKHIVIEMLVNNGSKMIPLDSRGGIYNIQENDSISNAISNASSAIKATKDASSSDFVWYTSEMTDNDIAAKETIVKFKNALKEHEFVVFYQPKVNMAANKLCGCEALVRWINNGKLLSPSKFIPILEEEGCITDLDFYVFKQICKDIAEWKSKGIKPVRISSNFSKLHLKNKDFADRIFDILERYDIESDYIEIELTESSGYEDHDEMIDFVNKMKARNIYTALDDFGTGYSSLSILKDIDIDVIKLDKSFLNDAENEKKQKMVENVVKMINDLDKKVICEGVETIQQVEFLKSVNCLTAQGFYYDKPLTHDEFQKRLINPIYRPKVKK